MRDGDVRKALKAKVFKSHIKDPNTLVVEELGLRHGACRVDIAVVNGALHGFEIKSDADTLERLPSQIEVYGAVLDRATLVVGERHAAGINGLLPEWWGIKLAVEGRRGAIDFLELQKPRKNPNINPLALCELLWRPEAVNILRNMGATESFLRKPRSILYQFLADTVELSELGTLVRSCLKARVNWLDQRQLSLSADLCRPKPTLLDFPY